jgi:hypothetical protein
MSEQAQMPPPRLRCPSLTRTEADGAPYAGAMPPVSPIAFSVRQARGDARHALLRREGWPVKTRLIYRELGLQLRASTARPATSS